MRKGSLCRDQPINKPDVAAWEVWVRLMRKFRVIRIPTGLGKEKEDGVSTELHVFCDASGNGHGAVAYAWRKPAN